MIIQKSSSANCSQVPNQEEVLPLVVTAEAVSLAIESSDFPSSDLDYINKMPKDVLSLVFEFTESYAAESLVSKKFNKSIENQACLFFHKLYEELIQYTLYIDIPTFEHLINAKAEDSYSEKIKKALQYLNDIGQRFGLAPIVLPKKNEEGGKSEDIYSISMDSLYKRPFCLMHKLLDNFRKPLIAKEIFCNASNLALFIAGYEENLEDRGRIQEIKQIYYKLISNDPNFKIFQIQLIEKIKALRNPKLALETFIEKERDLVEFTECINNLESQFADHCAARIEESDELFEDLRLFSSVMDNPVFDEMGNLIERSTIDICMEFNIPKM